MMRMVGTIAASALAWGPSPVFADEIAERHDACTSSSGPASLPDLPEASGLARSASGLLWSHNDSGAPVIFAFDSNGQPAGRLTIGGARVEDWEAIASGPCSSGTCLFVADIGDNDAKRQRITIYRIGPIAVYRFPKVLAGSPMRLERVGQAIADKAVATERVTDGAISADGRLVMLRTRDSLTFYRGPEFLRGDFQVIARSNLSALAEPQGEGVAFGAGDVVYVASEGGGKKSPGRLGVLSCRP